MVKFSGTVTHSILITKVTKFVYVYAAGYTGGYMSVFLYLMKGLYDDQLRWPLRDVARIF